MPAAQHSQGGGRRPLLLCLLFPRGSPRDAALLAARATISAAMRVDHVATPLLTEGRGWQAGCVRARGCRCRSMHASFCGCNTTRPPFLRTVLTVQRPEVCRERDRYQHAAHLERSRTVLVEGSDRRQLAAGNNSSVESAGVWRPYCSAPPPLIIELSPAHYLW